MDQFAVRKYVINAIFIVIASIFIIRLFYLQVINTSYKLSAENNSKRIEIEYPARGLIYDRNGEWLVYNQPAYDLMIAPYELKSFDSTELCEILNIDIKRLRDGIKWSYRHRRDPFIKQIAPETYALFQEKLYKFPGFYFRPRTLRRYRKEIAAHVLGYVGEVDESIIEKNSYYVLGDYIGISGIEQSYEQYLRGKKGQKVYLVDVHSRIKGEYQGGRFDKDAEVGQNIVCTIDAKLQEYGEKLMKNYSGSIVAIEPSTGEVLALISSPSYDPSLLIGRQRSSNYLKLEQDTLEPLFNRALMANYPPGSTFKPMNAMIGLQEGVINYNTKFYCDLGYYARGVHVGCHDHPSPLNLPQSIQHSCNAYYCNVYRRILEDPKFNSVADAYNNWRSHVMSFGFGHSLNSDFTNELRGFLPPSSYFDRYYGENGWKALTVISMAIGQGEVLITPLQLANMSATIANRGYYYIPHIVKDIEGLDTIDSRFTEKHYCSIDSASIEIIVEGMEMAVNGGPGSTARIARLQDIIVCGKTGTAENPHGEDHSVFTAFAPKDTPRIAIAVYVEHGKWGASYAAPIASLMIEKYLTDTIAYNRKWLEQHMLNQNLLTKTQ
jgi:penicillin-binding protein 2